MTVSQDGDPLPLSALLSYALVAFTIEFDNEFEREISGSGAAPVFLVSMVMWSNFMRFLGEEGTPVRALSASAGVSDAPVHPSLAGMERWGYIVVRPDPADDRTKPPRRDWIVRPTAVGVRAMRVWPQLFGVVEERWRARIGDDGIRSLRASLRTVVGPRDTDLPEYLPVVGKAMFVELPEREGREPAEQTEVRGDDPSGDHLATLLARVLLAFTIEYERDAEVSLTMSANVVRILDARGVRVRDLPRLGGVSKEAISMSVGFLERSGYVTVEPDPTADRSKLARLTAKGLEAQEMHHRRLGVVEQHWRTRFGAENVRGLRESLEQLVGDPDLERSPLSAGLEPYPGGWRASVRRPDRLPHHPMVLHRGGWPDGS